MHWGVRTRESANEVARRVFLNPKPVRACIPWWHCVLWPCPTLGLHPRSHPHPELHRKPVTGTLHGTGDGAAAPTQICQPLGRKRSAAATAAWATTEARASGRWSHPNIVRTLKHCSVLTPGAPQPAAAQHARVHPRSAPPHPPVLRSLCHPLHPNAPKIKLENPENPKIDGLGRPPTSTSTSIHLHPRCAAAGRGTSRTCIPAQPPTSSCLAIHCTLMPPK